MFCLQICIAWWTGFQHLIRYFWVDTISQQAIDVLKCLLLQFSLGMWWHVVSLQKQGMIWHAGVRGDSSNAYRIACPSTYVCFIAAQMPRGTRERRSIWSNAWR